MRLLYRLVSPRAPGNRTQPPGGDPCWVGFIWYWIFKADCECYCRIYIKTGFSMQFKSTIKECKVQRPQSSSKGFFLLRANVHLLLSLDYKQHLCVSVQTEGSGVICVRLIKGYPCCCCWMLFEQPHSNQQSVDSGLRPWLVTQAVALVVPAASLSNDGCFVLLTNLSIRSIEKQHVWLTT